MDSIGTGKNFPPENPNFIQRSVCYFLAVGVVTPAIGFFMNLLNQTRVTGRENIARLKPPYIVASNHLTLLDDLFLAPIIFSPQLFRGYDYIPYHAPEERNFYKNPLIAAFMRSMKAIPLIRGRGVYQEGMNRLIQAVKEGGVLQIYPEGTRTRTGEIGNGKEGVGRIVLESGAPVIPMFHQGLEKILPIGNGIPSFGREIRVAIGQPLTFDATPSPPNTPDTWRSISNRIMDAIREQKTVADQLWGEKPVRVKAAKKS